ncbi:MULTISPECIES: GntR family transcriptional regulator [Silvimonas]|uniref:GntR family transcriptional regulator n=1 Tax=Silvimonas TaxID=300264 RepID=UPI0024B37E5A|nr:MULTISPECIES: GntR family transcriptional regulator [Silvimonas]MDR3428463.1 GntR family transcriptional regulator [Silvimonas sp.]
MKKLIAQSLYQQVLREVLTDIESGMWQGDEALPSEQELAQRFGVSQGTVRKALDGLVADGVLYRRQGVGTFVTEAGDELSGLRFASLNDYNARTPKVEVLSCVKIHAGEHLAEILHLRRSAPLWQIRRLVRVDGEVIGVEESLLSEVTFPALDMRKLRELGGNIRAVCWRDYQVRLKSGDVRYRAVPAAQAEARLLQIEVNEPVLQVVRLARDFDDVPQVWSVAWFSSEKYALQALEDDH